MINEAFFRPTRPAKESMAEQNQENQEPRGMEVKQSLFR